MSTLISIVVRLALIYAAFKVFFWARKLANADAVRWRRRIGLLLFLLPSLLWGARLVLPQALLTPLESLLWFDHLLTSLHEQVGAKLGEHLGALWRLALSPLVYALLYGSVGVLIGYPLDRWRRRRLAPTEATTTAQTANTIEVIDTDSKR